MAWGCEIQKMLGCELPNSFGDISGLLPIIAVAGGGLVLVKFLFGNLGKRSAFA